MSQVRKTIFTILTLMLGLSLITGCGIQGDLYAPGATETAVAVPQPASESASQSDPQPAAEAADSETTEHGPVVE